ncbi:MAG TPA: EcsC family protein [Ktedonobacterales bacterium]|nr:EcsC family protein [Ktedonobacterales bacterium]
MTAADDQQEEQYLNPAGGVVGKAFDAVPPEVQSLLNVKPGRTSERIRQVISWAAAVDPEVLRLHQRHNKSIHTLDDIRNEPVRERDQVAHHFAAQYRHRAALTGAVTALPGGMWALVGMGADVQLTAIYAVRMAAKVAQSYGYDTSTIEEQVRLADVLALAAGIDSLRGIGNWLTREGMAQVLPDVLPRVLARISVELTTEQAAKWVGRIIPGVSAVVGGAVDYAFLRAAGERAIAYYHNRALADRQALPSGAQPLALPAATETGAASDAAAIAAAPRIVEADSAPAPSASMAPKALPPAESPGQTTSAVVAASSVTAAPEPATPKRAARRSRPWALYLAIFVVIMLVATIIACAALGSLLTSAIHLH